MHILITHTPSTPLASSPRRLSRLIGLSCVFFFTCFLLSSVQAEVRPKGYQITVFGGVFQGTSKVDNAPYLGAQVGYHLNRLLTFELSHGLIPTQGIQVFDEFDLSNQGIKNDVLIQQGAGRFVVHLSKNRFAPFFNLGLGWVVADDQANALMNAGMGGDYFIQRNLSLRFAFDYWASSLILYNQPYEQFTATLGVSYHLGGQKDIDKDGIPNNKDQCPTLAEDKDGFQDKDGCPEKDNDEDGIPDDKDQCKNEAEDKDKDRDEDGCPDIDDDGDGILNEQDLCKDEPEDKDSFKDDDGCPDLDNDEDGIPDDKDQCKNVKESMNNFQDEDGCPEKDQDKDGLFDSQDKCKDKAETVNGFMDEDGCPDEIPKQVKDQLGLHPKIKFMKKSSKWIRNRKSEQHLDLVAAVLKPYTFKIKVIASAHSGRDLQTLSEKRAQAIKEALVARGIDAGRISTKGENNKKTPGTYLIRQKMSEYKNWIIIDLDQ
jgi:outer membrane protein OmpA-like peptidoglycan-associated protein